MRKSVSSDRVIVLGGACCVAPPVRVDGVVVDLNDVVDGGVGGVGVGLGGSGVVADVVLGVGAVAVLGVVVVGDGAGVALGRSCGAGGTSDGNIFLKRSSRQWNASGLSGRNISAAGTITDFAFEDCLQIAPRMNASAASNTFRQWHSLRAVLSRMRSYQTMASMSLSNPSMTR